MIRPEIKAGFWKWRDVILSAALVALGLYWGLLSTGILRVLGLGLIVLGLGLAYGGWQRVRFRNRAAGPGVVTLDERRVIYMGPEDGGVADLDLMVQLDLAQPRGMGPAWRIINADGNHLDIPVGAAGADQLFDAFTALPGMKTDYMLSLLDQPRPAGMTVWIAPDHKPRRQLH
ncbi:MAG: hypothetical protein AAGL89_14480 [Pseudomonadota bacterium]